MTSENGKKRAQSRTDKEETNYKRKKGTTLADGLDYIGTQMGRLIDQRGALERAVDLLQKEYKDKLTTDELVLGLGLLSDTAMATVFLRINIKDLRDQWLHANLQSLTKDL